MRAIVAALALFSLLACGGGEEAGRSAPPPDPDRLLVSLPDSQGARFLLAPDRFVPQGRLLEIRLGRTATGSMPGEETTAEGGEEEPLGVFAPSETGSLVARVIVPGAETLALRFLEGEEPVSERALLSLPPEMPDAPELPDLSLSPSEGGGLRIEGEPGAFPSGFALALGKIEGGGVAFVTPAGDGVIEAPLPVIEGERIALFLYAFTEGGERRAGFPRILSVAPPPTPGGGDRTPPEVVALEPADGALDVPLETTITARFSEPVENVSNATFRLLDPEGNLVLGHLETTEDQALLRPFASLLPETAYRVELTEEIHDRAGNPLLPERIRFTTTEATPSAILAAGSGIARLPLNLPVDLTDAPLPLEREGRVLAAALLPQVDRLLVATDAGLLHLFDITDPAHPSEVIVRSIAPAGIDLAADPPDTIDGVAIFPQGGNAAILVRASHALPQGVPHPCAFYRIEGRHGGFLVEARPLHTLSPEEIIARRSPDGRTIWALGGTPLGASADTIVSGILEIDAESGEERRLSREGTEGITFPQADQAISFDRIDLRLHDLVLTPQGETAFVAVTSTDPEHPDGELIAVDLLRRVPHDTDPAPGVQGVTSPRLPLRLAYVSPEPSRLLALGEGGDLLRFSVSPDSGRTEFLDLLPLPPLHAPRLSIDAEGGFALVTATETFEGTLLIDLSDFSLVREAKALREARFVHDALWGVETLSEERPPRDELVISTFGGESQRRLPLPPDARGHHLFLDEDGGTAGVLSAIGTERVISLFSIPERTYLEVAVTASTIETFPSSGGTVLATEGARTFLAPPGGGTIEIYTNGDWQRRSTFESGLRSVEKIVLSVQGRYALAADLGRGELVLFDPEMPQEEGRSLSVGTSLTDVGYAVSADRFFAADGLSGRLLPIDPERGEVTGEIPLRGVFPAPLLTVSARGADRFSEVSGIRGNLVIGVGSPRDRPPFVVLIDLTADSGRVVFSGPLEGVTSGVISVAYLGTEGGDPVLLLESESGLFRVVLRIVGEGQLEPAVFPVTVAGAEMLHIGGAFDRLEGPFGFLFSGARGWLIDPAGRIVTARFPATDTAVAAVHLPLPNLPETAAFPEPRE